MSQRGMSAKLAMRKVAGVLAKGVTCVGGANDVVSGAASGDGSTVMLEGIMVMENWKALGISALGI